MDECRMIPHQTKCGAAALVRLKACEVVPPPYDKIKRMVIPDAFKYLIFASLLDFFDVSIMGFVLQSYASSTWA